MPITTKQQRKQRGQVTLRSEELNEVIKQVPSWLTRWGITILFGILSLVLVGSYVIEYPDIVQAPFQLSSQNVPKPVLARMDAKLAQFFAVEHQKVEKGQIIAELESAADAQEVLLLSVWLDSVAGLVRRKGLTDLSMPGKPEFRRLGELQPHYLEFDQAYMEFVSFLPQGFYQRKKELVELDLQHLKNLRLKLQAQRELCLRDAELAENEFASQRLLYEQKVTSSSEYQREESRLLAKKLPLQLIEAGLVENLAAQNAKEKELLELNRLFTEQANRFEQHLNLLKSSIRNWEQRYLLIAPIAGRLQMQSFLQENQQLKAGQEVFFISAEHEDILGEAIIPQYNFGKVKNGQEVLIRLDSYPAHEFGVVKGKIDFISEIPIPNKGFAARISLPDGLRTTYGENLTYRSGMTATAEIVTDKNRLIEKIFFSLKDAMKR